LEEVRSKVPKAWHSLETFLDPRDAEERGVAMLPGRARSVAGSIVEELQRGRQKSAEGLRNWDRTEDELREMQSAQRLPLTILLDGLGPQEVGCLMRTCEAAGVQELLLCDDTPGPPDARVLKTSLKAEVFLPCRRVGPLETELPRLEEAGFQTWSLEWTEVSDARRAPFFPEVQVLRPPLALALSADVKNDRRISVPCIGDECSIGVIGSVVIYNCLKYLKLI